MKSLVISERDNRVFPLFVIT